MVTLKDIAAEAGVSITTVSNVVHNRTSRVSPEMVERIWEIIDREHYVPSMTARTLANNDSSIIGVITHKTPQNAGSTLSDPFLGIFYEGIESRTREEGYYMMMRAVENARALESLCRSWRLSGLILAGMFPDEFYECIRRLDIPFVLIDNYVNLDGVYNIGLEDEEGSYLATKYLLDRGHRVIAFASPTIRAGGVVEKRFEGYCRALADAGIKPDESLVFTQEISVEEGVKLGHVLADRTDISGIVASADILAAGIMAGLHEKGLSVPNDKSIVGFDDNYICKLTNPTLSTVHQDAEQKGIIAADLILAQLRHETVEQRSIVLPVYLVERESVRSITNLNGEI